MGGRRPAARELILLCVLATSVAAPGFGQQLPKWVASQGHAGHAAWVPENPGTHVLLACATDRNAADRRRHLGAQLLPPRDDSAWEGLAAGVGFGLLIGLGLNAAYAEQGGGRSVGDFLVTLFLPVAVTAPLGLMIGSAVPKRSSPSDSPDSVGVGEFSTRSSEWVGPPTYTEHWPMVSACVPSPALWPHVPTHPHYGSGDGSTWQLGT